MSFETPKDFQKYAQDCVKLAQQPNTPSELRQQLFQMAREWMQAMMAEEEDASTIPKKSRRLHVPLAPTLLRPSGEKMLDAIQYVLVVVRLLQGRPDLTQLSRVPHCALRRPCEQDFQFGSD